MSWISFKTQKTTKSCTYEMNLVQEVRETRAKSAYQLVARLGGRSYLIPHPQKKQILFNIMRTTLARKMER